MFFIINIVVFGAAHATSLEYYVPATVYRRGDWFVEVSVSSSNVSAEVPLVVYQYDVAPHNGNLSELAAAGAPVAFTFLGGQEADQSLYSYSSETVEFEPEPWVSVWPTSELLRHAGSVALVRSRDTRPYLVIESLMSSFEAHCKQNSLIRVDMTNPNLTSSFLQFPEAIRVGFKDVVVSVGGVLFETRLRMGPALHEGPEIANIPEDVYVQIVSDMVNAGAIYERDEDGRYGQFRNCVLSVMERLPEIRLRFPYTQDIVLKPFEYIYLDPLPPHLSDDSQCELLLKPNRWPYVMLNPLRIPGKNFRISHNGIWEICDAL